MMGKFVVTGPDGQKYEITAPEGASEQDVLSFVQRQVGGKQEGAGYVAITGDGQRNEFTVPESMPDQEVMDYARQRYPEAGDIRRTSPTKWAKEGGNSLTWNGATNFSNGVLQGFGDEVGAATLAAKESLTGGLPFGKAYDQALPQVQDARTRYNAENPKTGMATDIAGQVAPWLLGGGAVNAPKMIAGATTMPGKMAAGAATGGAVGGISGFTNAEGDIADRGKGAMQGAGIGAFTGGIAPPLVEAIGRAGRAGLQKILNGAGSGFTKAEQKLANVITEMGGGDLARGVAIVRSQLSRGRDNAIVDATGIGGQKLGRAVANVPGQSAQMADDFVAARAGGRGARMQDAADKLAPNAFHSNLETLTASQRKSASPLYEEAFAPVSDASGRVYARWDDRLQQFLDDPIVRQGLNKGVRIQQLEALADGRPFSFQELAVKGFDDAGNVIIDGTPNLRAMDAAKRGIDDILEGYRDKTTGRLALDDMGRAIESVRKALVAKLDDITTDQSGRSAYKEARAAYAGPAQTKDAMWSGRRFARGDEEMTRKIFDAMSDGQKDAFRLGVRRELSGMVNKDTQAAVGKFADKRADLWGRLEAIFPPNEFAAFRKAIEAERGRFQTDQFISPRAGSHTTGLKEDIADLGRAPSMVLDVAGNLATGNKLGALGALLRKPYEKMTAPDPKVSKDLADLLFSLDPARQQQMLGALDSKMVAERVLPMLAPDQRKMMAELLARGATPALASQSVQSGQRP